MSEEIARISKSELERLRAIESAVRRFDETGSAVHQMNPKQWQAYTELKALFHGGIEGQAESEDNAFRRLVTEIVVADIKANGEIRMALLGM